MVLARIGWLANSASSITIHTGQTLDLAEISPGAVAGLALKTTQHWSDVQTTAARTSASPGFSIFWDALRPLLRGRMPTDWSQRHRNALVFLLAGGEWPQARQHTFGKSPHPVCLRCNLERCTVWHRRYECEAWAFARQQNTSEQLRQAASRLTNNLAQERFAKGLLPTPFAVLPPQSITRTPYPLVPEAG